MAASEIELIKAMIQRLVKLEKSTVQRDDIERLERLYVEQMNYTRAIFALLNELKEALDARHIENMNADDMIIRSILNSSHSKNILSVK